MEISLTWRVGPKDCDAPEQATLNVSRAAVTKVMIVREKITIIRTKTKIGVFLFLPIFGTIDRLTDSLGYDLDFATNLDD